MNVISGGPLISQEATVIEDSHAEWVQGHRRTSVEKGVVKVLPKELPRPIDTQGTA
jgi:hypothetical protein